jgi:hypothetical protein
VEFYKKRYISASKGNYDIYVVFVEKGLGLMNSRGRLGFILPHKFFNAQYGEPLRGLISKGNHLSEVVHFGDKQVFTGATTYTCLMFLEKTKVDGCRFEKVEDIDGWRTAQGRNGNVPVPEKPPTLQGTVPANIIGRAEWHFTVGQGAELFEKLRLVQTKLGDVASLFVGLQTDADDVFILEERERKEGLILCKSKATGLEHWFEDEHLKPFLKGSLNIRRYQLANVSKRLIFPYQLKAGRSILIDSGEYQRNFPLTWRYLEENQKRLAQRNHAQMGREWYGYVYKKNHTRFGMRKLLVPSIGSGSCFTIDEEGKYYFVGSGGGGGGGYGITLSAGTRISDLFLLGLLNSRLLETYLKTISTPFRGGYIALNRQVIGQLPVRTINFSYPSDKVLHDRMVQMVEQMLSLNKQLVAVKTDHEKTALQRQIDATDRQIDLLVYELYGLTDEEIRIVEESRS